MAVLPVSKTHARQKDVIARARTSLCERDMKCFSDINKQTGGIESRCVYISGAESHEESHNGYPE